MDPHKTHLAPEGHWKIIHFTGLVLIYITLNAVDENIVVEGKSVVKKKSLLLTVTSISGILYLLLSNGKLLVLLA